MVLRIVIGRNTATRHPQIVDVFRVDRPVWDLGEFFRLTEAGDAVLEPRAALHLFDGKDMVAGSPPGLTHAEREEVVDAIDDVLVELQQPETRCA